MHPHRIPNQNQILSQIRPKILAPSSIAPSRAPVPFLRHHPHRHWARMGCPAVEIRHHIDPLPIPMIGATRYLPLPGSKNNILLRRLNRLHPRPGKIYLSRVPIRIGILNSHSINNSTSSPINSNTGSPSISSRNTSSPSISSGHNTSNSTSHISKTKPIRDNIVLIRTGATITSLAMVAISIKILTPISLNTKTLMGAGINSSNPGLIHTKIKISIGLPERAEETDSLP